jgi:IQ motif/SEC7 domain-containing protein
MGLTVLPTSPHQGEEQEEDLMLIPEDPYSYWVSSPQFITSPDTARFYRATLQAGSNNGGGVPIQNPASQYFPPQHLSLHYQAGGGHGPNCCCHHGPAAAPVYETYQDLYGMVRQQQRQQQQMSAAALYSTAAGLTADQAASKLKKTVRIQLPAPSSGSDMEAAVNSASAAAASMAAPADDETVRRRNYRVGLNIFNMNPERGIEYLMRKDFIETRSPAAVAKFLAGRKGLSRRMVGEYICSLQKPFNMAVLAAMIFDMDFSGLHLDIALRQLLTEIHIPGEAQKIEKLVEVFARRYIECNQMFVAGFRAPDTIFVLAYAMVLLNTDLHNGSIKPERKMRQEDFVRNLRGIDAGADVDADMLRGIYDRIRAAEFRQAPDHVTQVSRVEATITGGNKRAPKLSAATWRRLVCFCRVTEVTDINKKEKKDAHQRGLFLFNDLLVVTKAEKSSSSSRKNKAGGGGQVHAHRYSLGLADLRVNMFRTTQHQFGVQLQERHTGRLAATFACRSYNDQQRFVSDLQESIAETEEMERARVFM